MTAEVASPITLEFLQKLIHAHYARLARCVVFTGDIYGLFPISQGDSIKFVPLEELLENAFHNAKYPEQQVDDKFVVLTVKSDGIHIASKDEGVKNFLGNIIEEFEGKSASLLDNIKVVSKILRKVADTRDAISEDTSQHMPPLCVIFDQAETIFASVEGGRMNTQFVEAWRWFSDLIRDEDLWPNAESANERSDLIILLSPTTAELNSKIFSLPNTEHIEIPLPQSFHGLLPPDLENDARGLTIRTVNNLVVASKRDSKNSSLTRQLIVDEITKRLQLELKDTIKIVRPDHTMADVVGWSRLKPRLRHLARRIDNSKRAPGGMVVTGPNGSGKTFGIEAWAAQIGRTVLNLGAGMKSKWYGEQGQFLERFEGIVSAHRRTCVVIDEAHKAFGSIHDPDTYQAEAEYARHIIQMMSNPKYRSKVFWVLITTRPDLLDPDFKRSGRCSLFVPICDPEGEDFDTFFKWMIESLEKEGIALDQQIRDQLYQKAQKENYSFSAGDFRRFIDELIDERDYWQNEIKSEFNISEFIKEWKPSAARIGKERRLHTLLAAKDADWRELVPAEFRNMSESEIEKEINELKLLIDISN